MDIKVDKSTVIVFDLDDTLYNELDYLKSAYKEIAIYIARENHKELYTRMFSLYRNNENVFKFLTDNFSIEFSKLIELYRNHYPSIKLFDGALETLKAIKDRNGKVGLITDGREQTQMAKLKALGIDHFLDEIVISEVVGSEKPAEENYKLIEAHFPNCHYCYIADNLKKDFITPNRLKWSTIGLIDNGLNIHFQSHKYINEIHSPKNFILSYQEINIV